jgi:lysophospholipase L1-like esterase
MRNIFTYLVAGLVPLLTQSQQLARDTTLYKNDHYAERTAGFKSEPVITGRIIFLGNSITEFGDWKSLLNDSTVINRGIAGDNTYGVLARLDDIIIRNPKKLFLEIGINDFALDPGKQHTVRNILAIVRKIRLGSPGTKIFVLSMLPTNDNVKSNYPFAYNKGHKSDLINYQLSKAATQNAYYFINLNKVLRDKYGKLNTKFAMEDGIHLNPSGYHTWVMFLKSKGFM